MGTSTDPWAYDNERPAHVVDVPAFRMDTTPVTNAAFVEFVDAGGYDDSRWWTDEGWAWRTEAGLAHPQFWIRAEDGRWTRERFGRLEPVPGREPVQHVGWFEADAYARWRGARLPTEIEWEKAAAGASEAGGMFHPGRRFGPDEVGAHPEGRELVGLPRPAGRSLGVDRERLRGLPRLPLVPLPRVLRGVLRLGPLRVRAELQGASRVVRGPRRRSRAASRSATGICRSADRSSPASAARPTPEPLRMCRHLAYVGLPVVLRSLLFDAPHALVHQAQHPRYQHNGVDNPDGWGVGWSFAGDSRGEHERYRAATKMWEDTSFAGAETATTVLAAARYASPGSAAEVRQRRAVRGGALAVLAQRIRLRVPRAARRSAARLDQPRAGRRHRG